MNNFRTKRSLMNQDAKRMSELLYFEVLRLILVYKIYETSPIALDYAKRTVNRPMSLPFSMMDTDLKGIIVYFNEIKNARTLSSQESILLNRIKVDTPAIITFVKRIQNGMDIDNTEHFIINKLERDLNIDNPKLKAMAVIIRKWSSIDSRNMNLLLDKMDSYGTLYIRHSELTKVIHKLKKEFEHKSDYSKQKSNTITAADIISGLATLGIAKSAKSSRERNSNAWDVHKKHNK